ncbi:serine hydrolase [Pontibacter diazotrophicus]|uniref:Serine hydrolase n=1 Tax=Pontibacter diazotrophicus TaxID=1400979 RepID=A0A3D8L7Q3_9BACT|nr:serine hydrolase [Pontibacter diazotrophicus]RDV13435.1 serine hydrolase [Pontibacter diazotrophicus]
MKMPTPAKYLFAVLILLTSSIAAVSAQAITSQEIDNLVERTMQTFQVPGVAVAVVKDGKVAHMKGYGVRSLNSAQKIDENTLFGVASNSKAFTAASIGLLVEEGKLSWDDKVVKHIPEFRLYNDYVTEEFTIRDLLTHRSGLGLGAGDLMIFPDGNDFTVKDLLQNMQHLRSVSAFRTKYDNDNLLYIIAGEVVARVTGTSWSDFTEKRIMHPLGMTRSAASFDRLTDTTNTIDAHALVEGKLQVIDRYELPFAAAAGGIYTSVNDLSKWIMMLMNNGKYGDNNQKQLLSENIIQEQWTPQTIIPFRGTSSFNTHFTAYGLGWFLADTKGYKEVNHTGGLPGMVTQVTLLPELNLGIIVLTNQQSGEAFRTVTNTIKQAYLGMEAKDWVEHFREREAQYKAEAKTITDKTWQEIDAKLKDKKLKAALKDYTGTFEDKWFGQVDIYRKKNKLWFQSKRSPKLSGEMLYYKDNMFVVKWTDRSMDADAFVMYSPDQEGITMKAVSPLTDFSYDFHDLDFHRVLEKQRTTQPTTKNR